MKRLVMATIACLVLTACSGRKTYPGKGAANVDGVYAFFCMPENLHFCKPLVIINTDDGWVARYGGSEASDSLRLETAVDVDAAGDTTICFIEYYDGKRNGKYIQCSNDYYMDESRMVVMYVGEGSKDTMHFHCTFMQKFQTHIDPVETIRKLNESYEYHLTHFNDIAMWALYNIYNRPEITLATGLDFPWQEEDQYRYNVTSVGSLDKRVRIYNTYYGLNGNGHGNTVDYSILQYENGEGGISCIPDFSSFVFDYVYETGAFRPNFGHADTFNIYVATLDKGKYYLVETSWWDEVPTYFGETDYLQQNVVSLSAFSIRGGKFLPVNLFGGKPVVVCVADSITKDMHFFYDDNTKTIKVPHVNPSEYIFSGQYDVIKL